MTSSIQSTLLQKNICKNTTKSLHTTAYTAIPCGTFSPLFFFCHSTFPIASCYHAHCLGAHVKCCEHLPSVSSEPPDRTDLYSLVSKSSNTAHNCSQFRVCEKWNSVELNTQLMFTFVLWRWRLSALFWQCVTIHKSQPMNCNHCICEFAF